MLVPGWRALIPALQAPEGLRAGLGQPCTLRLQPFVSAGDTLVHTTPTPTAPPETAEGGRGGGRDSFLFLFAEVSVAPSCTKVCSKVSIQGQAGPEPRPLSSGSPTGPCPEGRGMSSGLELARSLFGWPEEPFTAGRWTKESLWHKVGVQCLHLTDGALAGGNRLVGAIYQVFER